MYTVSETGIFQRYADEIWAEDERLGFIHWIAQNPFAGDVIPGAQGIRKVRWKSSGRGKRGGARVIYYNMLDDGHIWLLIVYTKAKFDNLDNATLLKLKEAMKDG
ncbi:transcriptional regulator [Oxalobacter vibrioformis]|uniref:Transcriptional regulator n=1 Tax=Oxalobacter vibrioformis TaxID=933080 RepID=A0A9E9LVB9_9BURK|nr:transcriptional regulator [Oxalobacter vibrioformis]WAW10385.1 transcriptional regulator [Oxalobacter vibrioformis]